jgi:hypothetical protein
VDGLNFEEFDSDGLQRKHARANTVVWLLETTTPETNVLALLLLLAQKRGPLIAFSTSCGLPLGEGWGLLFHAVAPHFTVRNEVSLYYWSLTSLVGQWSSNSPVLLPTNAGQLPCRTTVSRCCSISNSC